MVELAYKTKLGKVYQSTAEEFLSSSQSKSLEGKVQLIFTSPPFPLNRKKQYGNLTGDKYLEWFSMLPTLFSKILSPKGSIVIEIGNAWEPGLPVMSTLAIKCLLAFQEKGEYYLCQQFICNNPARLPSPAQWVNVERVRVKDSFHHVWWMSPISNPRADNRRVLLPYSKAMKKLLSDKKYNHGLRPSEHRIGKKSFFTDNEGSIPSNVLSFSNTASTDNYLQYCKQRQLVPHPARMPVELPMFFISFLTEPGDIVFDPFSGSNTTGYSAEKLDRKWASVEPNAQYIQGSIGRFDLEEVLWTR